MQLTSGMLGRTAIMALCVAAAGFFGGSPVRAGDVAVVPLLQDDGSNAAAEGPLRIRGARNGSFSGKIVAPFGTRADAPTLTGPGGAALPAEAVTVRYAHPDAPKRYKQRPAFDGLHPAPADRLAESKWHQPWDVQPIWLTVHVPADARPGTYRGTWSVAGTDIPVELTVADWKIPDPADWVTHVGFIQSPDSVAMQYEVEMWSPRHWELIGRSFDLLAALGTDTIYIPVQRRTHFGNEHGMVVWEKVDGKLRPDLSIVAKYIETAVARLGKVPVVCLVAWELDGADASHYPAGVSRDERDKDRKILISVREGGKLTEAEGPAWGTPECRAFWKPVLDGVRKILAGHGMEKSMMVGISGDWVPSPEAVGDLASASGKAKWVAHAHTGPDEVQGEPVGLTASVWGFHGPVDPAADRRWNWQRPRYYGWQRAEQTEWRLTSFPRYGSIYGGAVSARTHQPLAIYRAVGEMAMAASGKPKTSPGCNGVDRLGADFWPVLKGRNDSPICGRYPETSWGQLTLSTATEAILAPAAAGAVATGRYEMLREGLQETEARVAIERALLAPDRRAKLGPDAERLQKLLDDRIRGLRHGASNKGRNWAEWAKGDWQKDSAALFDAAATAAAAR